MFFLYSFVIFVHGLIIRLVSTFHAKARDFIEGRSGQIQNINIKLKDWPEKNRIWIHAASYGEFEMAIPIMTYLKKAIPDIKWIVSFYSPSGYLQHQFSDSDILKIYLPIDLKHQQEELVKAIKPNAVLFIKYEFWFNLLRVLKSEKVPYYFTSLHLNRDSYLLANWSGFLRKQIKNSQKIFAHNPESVEILMENGFKNVVHFGDSRINQVVENRNRPINIKWKNNSRVVMTIGSMGMEDMAMVEKFIFDNSDLNLIIAPHDIDEPTINKITQKINEPISLYSKEGNYPEHRILILDTMGDLKYMYGSSSITYIGGGFKKGPHNILEPLVFGNHIISGPNIRKFPMASYLRSLNLLDVIDNQSQLQDSVTQHLNSDYGDKQKKIDEFLETNTCKLDLLLVELNSMGIG